MIRRIAFSSRRGSEHFTLRFRRKLLTLFSGDIYCVYMSTKVIFNIDKKVKEAAMRKAKRRGTTLTSVLNHAARAYAEDRLEVDVLDEVIRQGLADVKAGRVISQEALFRRLGL